jgi:hypothetical protein
MVSPRAEWVASTGTLDPMVPMRCDTMIEANGSCFVSSDIGRPSALSVEDRAKAVSSRSRTQACSTLSIAARPAASR